MKYYAGIGSRNTPTAIQMEMMFLGRMAAKKGLILRSGGANGADLAFERGCDSAKGIKQIYLPFKGFNESDSPYYKVCEEAMCMAEALHPNWRACGRVAKLLMARNCYQILDRSLDSPVDFVVCYTSDGTFKGGTGQALRLAKEQGIKIYNLYFRSDYVDVLQTIRRDYKHLR